MMLCICSTTVNGVVLAFRKLKFEFLRSIGSLMNRRVENEITNAKGWWKKYSFVSFGSIEDIWCSLYF